MGNVSLKIIGGVSYVVVVLKMFSTSYCIAFALRIAGWHSMHSILGSKP